MSTVCKYCEEPEHKQDWPGLVCKRCNCFVHLDCLRRPGTPGDFASDVFFEFTCEDCSEDKKEVFQRNKFPWVNVILLTLHHLSTQSHGISNNGFFHYKTHICSFIDRSWPLLFGAQTKQKKNWVGTIAGVLSVYSNYVFRSGSMVLGETGWWKLQHGFSPAVAADIIQEMAREKPKGRPRNHFAMDKVLFTQKATEMGYQHLINNDDDSTLMEPVESGPGPAKKKRFDSIDTNGSVPFYDQIDSDGRHDADEHYEELLATAREGSYSDAESVFRGFEFPPNQPPPFHSDSSSINSQPVHYYDSDSRDESSSHPAELHSDDGDAKKDAKPKKQEDKPFVKRESLFSTEPNSVDLPWVEKPPDRTKDLVEMSQYEEIQLLKQVEGLILKVKDPNKKASLCRLRAKLALRRLKRHKHLPLFDLDKAVKILGGYMTEDPRVVMNGERVLDRFQRSYLIDSLCGTIASAAYGSALVGRAAATPFRSALSGALLRPYVRRDPCPTPRPAWLRLTDELLARTHRHDPDYVLPPSATLDYSYVRPQHIAAVNNLCAQFFWPGIDLTESLQYPEYSCVVTYRRLVVGCAFLVPDARPGEAYISFVLVRPEWRNAKIASFMLYHLLQTCSGKDVTLHVSPTNPAIFLYQKFGFKVEELVQDFYEKYYDIEYKGCRHALFLRLIR